MSSITLSGSPLKLEGDQGVAFIMEWSVWLNTSVCARQGPFVKVLTSLTPRKRLLPVGFQTKAPSLIRSRIARVDEHVASLRGDGERPILIGVETVIEAVSEALSLLNLTEEDLCLRRTCVRCCYPLS